MRSVARTMALLTLPAAAVGALAGLVLRDVADDPNAQPAPLAAAPDRTEGGRPPRRERPEPGSRRAGSTRRVVGNAPDGVRPLDPSFAARLSSPDEDVRNACALELLRAGTSQTAAIDLLTPTTPEGVKLRDAIVNSLTVLAMNESGGNWEMLSEQGRLEVRLKYFAKVVPESSLRDERKRFWAVRVAGDADRLATGAIEKGEAAWAVLELARVRRELGEVGQDEWLKLRAERIGALRAWAASLAAEPRTRRDEVRAVTESLEKIEQLDK
jgi:hypothetical protein